jgi:glucans biosynthesis protein
MSLLLTGSPRRSERTSYCLLLALTVALLCGSGARAFDLKDVQEKAQALAQKDYDQPAKVPSWLLELNYDQWRNIRFHSDRALWRDRAVPFQVQFFHPGLYYDRTVTINVVEGDGIRTVKFSPDQFSYGLNDFASRVPQELGYAGFRIHAPFKTKDYPDEVIVFLGATYFRAVGRDQAFGLSARGLAIDTAESHGEEFPFFKEFWLLSPGPKATEIVVFALLDSPSLTGAYRFIVRPGEETTVDVESHLYLRREVRKLGIAPLTSMLFHGENTQRHFDDFRPEVHDSDGLLLNYASGEWLWRPLDNPADLNVNGFQMENPAGFGMIQRDRDFDHYQDLETRAERRPSCWVEPRGAWGKGRVELVEIPTNSDTNDNIVAYWVPEQSPKPGEEVTYSYILHWYGDDPSRPPGGRVVATRRDAGRVEDVRRFVIDFEGKKLERIPPDQVLRGVVTVVGGDAKGRLVDQHVVKNPLTGGWRLTFQVKPEDPPFDLRAFLDRGGETLSETWSYQVLQ